MSVVFLHASLHAELHIFDFVDQAILSNIGMHPFIAYGVIHFGFFCEECMNIVQVGVVPCHFLSQFMQDSI